MVHPDGPIQRNASVQKQLKKLNTHEKHFLAGLFSGVIQAGVFNPWDRALYLSVKDKRRFLSKANWQQPFTGLSQSLLTRTLSGGLYFPLYDFFNDHYTIYLPLANDSILLSFLAGNSAGAVSGCLLNGFTAIKYQSWGTGDPLLTAARKMYKDGGIRPFTKGMLTTVLRDTTFGGVFASLKFGFFLMLQTDKNSKTTTYPLFPFTVLAAGFATIASAPFNYARNMKYCTPPGDKPPSIQGCITRMFQNAFKSTEPFSYVQQRLRLGWGTTRVAVGMAVGYELYDFAKNVLEAK